MSSDVASLKKLLVSRRVAIDVISYVDVYILSARSQTHTHAYSIQLLPVGQLTAAHPHLLPSDFILSQTLLHSDSSAAMLTGLSVLELCLLIAVRHLSDITCGEPFNFEMVYSGM